MMGGCAITGTSPAYQQQAIAERDNAASWPSSTPATTLALNQLIESDDLDKLIGEALQANPSLQQTLLSVEIYQAQWRQAFGERLPQLALAGSGGKTEGDGSSFNSSLTVSWQVDLWQSLSDRSRAAGKDVEQQQQLYQGAQDTLVANVMNAWLGLITTQRTIAIQQQRIATLTNNAQFIVQRYRNGTGSLDDMTSARSVLASEEANLEYYTESLQQQQRALRTLLGRSQGSPITVEDTFPQVIAPLADLPAQTLARRPDLQAAYAAIEAASLRSSAAYKDLLPSISLEAALLDSDGKLSNALLSDPLWSLLGQLTAPLYMGGQLRAAADIAELQTAQAYQNYRETLYSAVTEVENALGQEQSLARQQAHIETALANAKINLTQYRASYRSGLASILDLLTVEQKTYDLENQLNDLLYQRLSNRVSLGLALGLGVAQ
ncbi:Cation efflux system protein CusC [Halioglobus japonicus]|nr:Cation efflux system protein CusC [Halioglobus japonicus]